MTHRDRLRALIRLPWIITRLWRALDAWGDSDWALMVSLLQPIAEKNLDTDTDQVLLGLAHTRLAQFDQAIWYFEQVTGKRLLQRERIIYCNTYAYALHRCGQLAKAKAHVQKFSRIDWPPAQRDWADALLQTPIPPAELSEDVVGPPRIFH